MDVLSATLMSIPKRGLRNRALLSSNKVKSVIIGIIKDGFVTVFCEFVWGLMLLMKIYIISAGV